jgi:spermidine/putrescine-binding protein
MPMSSVINQTGLTLTIIAFMLAFACNSTPLVAQDTLKILTWEGYVQQQDLTNINQKLKDDGYDITAEIIQPFASGPLQMFNMIRQGNADISFLTLNYIKMQDNKLVPLLQPINIDSPRLRNYQELRPELTRISMGMVENKPLYLPFGGGTYGIWANMKRLTPEQLPTSITELWLPQWQGKLSLTSGQIQPNIALVMLAMGLPPYHINDLLNLPKEDTLLFRSRRQAINISRGMAQEKLNQLYQQVAYFWETAPTYQDDVLLTASYGIEITQLNAQGGQWQFIKFDEGSTTWLDTINFSIDLEGKRLEAAEIIANYFLSKEVQTRVVSELGMVAVSTLVDTNPMLDANPYFFYEQLFWPPYNKTATNIMQSMSGRAMKKRSEDRPNGSNNKIQKSAKK